MSVPFDPAYLMSLHEAFYTTQTHAAPNNAAEALVQELKKALTKKTFTFSWTESGETRSEKISLVTFFKNPLKLKEEFEDIERANGEVKEKGTYQEQPISKAGIFALRQFWKELLGENFPEDEDKALPLADISIDNLNDALKEVAEKNEANYKLAMMAVYQAFSKPYDPRAKGYLPSAKSQIDAAIPLMGMGTKQSMLLTLRNKLKDPNSELVPSIFYLVNPAQNTTFNPAQNTLDHAVLKASLRKFLKEQNSVQDTPDSYRIEQCRLAVELYAYLDQREHEAERGFFKMPRWVQRLFGGWKIAGVGKYDNLRSAKLHKLWVGFKQRFNDLEEKKALDKVSYSEIVPPSRFFIPFAQKATLTAEAMKTKYASDEAAQTAWGDKSNPGSLQLRLKAF